MTKRRFTLEPYGEFGWLARVHEIHDQIEGALFLNGAAEGLRGQSGIREAVAGIDTLALHFDGRVLSPEDARSALSTAIEQPHRRDSRDEIAPFELPVVYGGNDGPDFEALCEQTGLAPDSLINAHTARPYRVVTVGFAPGFAYLGPLDPKLKTDRLTTPRQRVAPGSVGVAGDFTGVYSLASPGGWRIIGRTPLSLFNKTAASPFFLKPGMTVRFRSVLQDKFDSLRKQIELP